MALILTRHPHQSVDCGDGLTITVLSVRGNCVKLAFDAPSTRKIIRTELKERDAQAAKEVNGNR